MAINFVITESVPSSKDSQFLEDRLYEYNAAQTGQDDGQFFSFLIRNDQQEIVAGISGWTWAKACEIRTLWVHDTWRGQGLGKRLLKAAEGKARASGCQVIFISSYSFQAPLFYQKQGYELTGQLDNFPPGFQVYFLKKQLVESA